MDIYYKKKKKNKRPKFNTYRKSKKIRSTRSPQRRSYVLRLRVCTPRKPNSARRPTVKAMLPATWKKALCHIPGSGHSLRRFSKALINGVGARDVPYVNYSCIRGKLDFLPLFSARRRRSIYGVSRPINASYHVRRVFRGLS